MSKRRKFDDGNGSNKAMRIEPNVLPNSGRAMLQPGLQLPNSGLAMLQPGSSNNQTSSTSVSVVSGGTSTKGMKGCNCAICQTSTQTNATGNGNMQALATPSGSGLNQQETTAQRLAAGDPGRGKGQETAEITSNAPNPKTDVPSTMRNSGFQPPQVAVLNPIGNAQGVLAGPKQRKAPRKRRQRVTVGPMKKPARPVRPLARAENFGQQVDYETSRPEYHPYRVVVPEVDIVNLQDNQENIENPEALRPEEIQQIRQIIVTKGMFGSGLEGSSKIPLTLTPLMEKNENETESPTTYGNSYSVQHLQSKVGPDDQLFTRPFSTIESKENDEQFNNNLTVGMPSLTQGATAVPRPLWLENGQVSRNTPCDTRPYLLNFNTTSNDIVVFKESQQPPNHRPNNPHYAPSSLTNSTCGNSQHPGTSINRNSLIPPNPAGGNTPSTSTSQTPAVVAFGANRNDENEGVVGAENECPICMEDYEVGQRLLVLPCTHRYHTVCIEEWFRRKSTCPECREDVREHLAQLRNRAEKVSRDKSWACEVI